MAVARRVVRYVAIGLATLVVLAMATVLVLARTGFGVERAGQLVLDRLERSINGTMTVGHFSSRNLLHGVMLHDVRITDPNGRPLLSADSAHLGYGVPGLLTGAVVFDNVALYAPDIVIERLPGDARWNHERVLSDTTSTDTTAGGGGLVVFRDATIVDGRVRVRTPWDPAVAGDTSRLILEAVPGGRVRTLRFDSVNARVPRVVLASPETEGQVVEVAALSVRAFIWRTPVAVDDLEGVITIQDTVVGFDVERVRLPSSELAVNGRVVTRGGRDEYRLHAEGSEVAFRDFQWLYPALPEEGGGSLTFDLETRPSGTLFHGRDAVLESGGSRVTGSFGVRTGEALHFTDVDVRLEPLELALLDSLTAGELPLSGSVVGSITAEGPAGGLRTHGDARYRTLDDGVARESSFRWDGVVGVVEPFRMEDTELVLESVDLAQVARLVPGLRLRGVAEGHVEADGSVRDGLQVAGDLALDHGDARSAINGSGRIALAETPTFDLHFAAEPVALELLGRQFPALEGLRGEARGPVTVFGTPDDLAIDVELSTPAGEVVMEAQLAVNGEPRYRAEGSVAEFRLDRVTQGVSETSITGRFQLDGSGVELEGLDGRLSVDILAASVHGVEVYRGALRGGVADGLARVDSFSVVTEVGDLTARGTFGLMEGRSGELAVNAMADSLVFLEPIFFADTPLLDVDAERVSRVDGRVTAEGRLMGSIAAWQASGQARIRSLVFDQLELGRGTLDVTWEPDSLSVEATLDSLEYADRRLARTQATASYAGGEGLVTATIQGREPQELELESTFQPQGDVVNLGLRRLRITARDGQWTLADTVAATVGGSGVSVDSLVLVRTPAPGRLRVTGVLPWRQPAADEVQEASLAVQLDSVRIDEFLRVTQSDTLVGGVLSGNLAVNGTALQPEVTGRLAARSFRYQRAVLDSADAQVDYRARRLEGRFIGWEGGATILRADFRVPVELALTKEEERLLDEPMDVSIRAAGVPAGLAAFLAPGFQNVQGRVEGEVTVAGTPVSPDLQAELRLVDASAYFEPLAVAYNDVQATARMNEGTVLDLDATLRTEHGRGRVQGTLDLADPTDPEFDLEVNAESMDATRRSDVTAVVNGVVRVSGRFARPIVTGDIRVVEGELNLDEIWRQRQIVQLDTTVFQMFDTTEVSYRPRPESPFLENLRITNTTVRMQRDFRLRSQELDVEVGGVLSVEVDRRSDDFRMTGTLRVIEGSYALLASRVPGGRRFEIRSGTIEFVGTPGIDPNLEITAAYRVPRAQGNPLTILAQVNGTLQDPRVSLTSNAELAMSETDLASYILFGRAGAELTRTEQDVVSAGGSLFYSLSRPLVSGVAASGLQQVASSLGLPLDYVALNLPEYGSQIGQAWQERGASALWTNAQIEIGFDPAQNVSVIGSVRLPGGETTPGSSLRLSGARVEYRPWETWTIEGYIEDQFARTPSFGPTEISDRKVLGLSFFREWGY